MKYIVHIIILFFIVTCYADEEKISLFPLDRYDQNIDHWIKPSDPDYNSPLLTTKRQQELTETFYKHYIGASSPWDSRYIKKIIQEDIKTMEKNVLMDYSNTNKSEKEIGFGENFRPYSAAWTTEITNNIHLEQFDRLRYQDRQRGIAIDNLHARALPTEDAHYYSYKIAGQGYPFDNLQMSSLWAGTPVYILGETRDRAWDLVITPDYIGWVKSNGIARANASFIKKWQTAARKNCVAITYTQTSIIDNKGNYRFLAYVGSVFPGKKVKNKFDIMIPVANTNQAAAIVNASISQDKAARIPLAATPHNFSRVMKTLLGRPYGWGNMYFYNDCSSELKNFFAPFGIWLPRHSADQVYVGQMTDMSASSPKERLDYLMESGRKFVTLIYTGGHVLLYIGNYPNPNDHALMAMSYQNKWGLNPNPSSRRAVIGKSVLFPLLLQYPEDTSLVSPVAKKYFQVSYLDEIPNYLIKLEIIDLKSLMYP